MKKLVFVFALLACLVFLSACSAVTASALPKPTDAFFVNDFADVIDDSDETRMLNQGVELFKKTGAQVVVVTLDTINGADIDEIGVELGRDWGIGDAEKDTGLLLLLAMEEREVAISVGYGLEGAVTDAQSGLFLDTYALPYFESADYSAGLAATYTALVNEVYLEFGMEADPNYVPIEQIESESGISLFALITLLVLLCIVSMGMRRVRRMYPGFFIVPHYHGNDFHHRGGGGFGGFGGGGGSFGGGGASRGF
jgi:uncharacterized protein